jgi:hypothetical protein
MSVVLWVIVAAVVLGVVAAVFGWDRYGRGRKAAGDSARPTDEVFIDPASGKSMRVWYNAATGEREYRPDSDSPPPP